MENQRLRDCLDTDFRRLREVASGADLGAAVPSCPGWAMADLLRHVAEVYLHKTECMRQGREPGPWPPEGLAEEPALALLDRSYAALTGEFGTRRPEQAAFSWYGPDQSVGFWIRRMAQETVIHRVDAELSARVPVAAIPADLAADGIAEVLEIFLAYGSVTWPDYFTETLASAGDRTAGVVTPEGRWLVRLTAKDVQVEWAGRGEPDATVEGSSADVLLWLWARGGEGVTTAGDEETIALFRTVLVTGTQ
jgi:uncharacterized protein (TIGR03083 family)